MNEFMPHVAKREAWGAGTMDRSATTRKVVLHNEGVDKPLERHDVWGVVEYVLGKGSGYHLIWDSVNDVFVQLYPATSAARSLYNPGTLPFSPNKQGTLCVQVCVVGFGQKPFTAGPMRGARRLVKWIDSLEIPRDARGFAKPGRGLKPWTRSGWHGHCHAPGNDHTDPGPIQLRRLFEAARRGT